MAIHDQNLRTQIANYKDYTTICNSAPSEILALIALQAKETVLARSLAIVQRNRTLAEDMFKELSGEFEWIPPRAGSIAFPRWLGRIPVEEFTDALVQAEGVLLLPGTVYDFPGNHFRLGLGRENAPEAMERLRRFVQRQYK